MKRVALVFSCLLLLAVPAKADDAATLGAMTVLADKGNAEAQYHVGMMHNNGIGTRQDPKVAFEWFRKSTASGDPLGAYKLGCYYAGQFAGVVPTDLAEALKYKLMAAEAGYSLAQHDVALMYEKQGNSAEALKWLKKAADQGDRSSLFGLSMMYSAGKATPRDLSSSYAYFKLSGVPSKNVNEMASTLSKAELAKGEELVSGFRPQPSALTIKAKSGLGAAEQLLKTATK